MSGVNATDETVLADLIRRDELTMSKDFAGRTLDADGWEHDTWHVTLRRLAIDRGKRPLTVAYRTGTDIGENFTAGDVLEAVLSDAKDGDLTFEEFCGEFDYDEDSRRAERTWQACQDVLGRLRTWLGTDLDAYLNAERINY